MDPNIPKDSLPIPTGEKQFADSAKNPGLTPAQIQKRKIIKVAIIGVVILLVFSLIPMVIITVSRSTKKQTTENNLVITPKPSVDPKATAELGPERIFIRTPASFNVPYDLKITLPSAWEAAFTDSPSKAYPWENSLLIQAIVSKFSPLSSTNLDVVSGNYIAIIDATEWLKTDKNVTTMSAAQKQQWFASLASITPENVSQLAGSIANPRLSSEAGGRQHLTAISASENNWRGISYLTNRATTDYTPEIITMMAGSLEGKNIVIYSQHNVRDTAWATISELKQRSDKETTAQINNTVGEFQRGLFGADTLSIHEEYLKSIATISIKLAQ
jgi:hypothetical protein